MVDLEVEEERDGMLLAKLSTESWEINVRATPTELAALADIRTADWISRGSIRAGSVAGVPAFWSVAEQSASLVLGADDETWDVAVSLPIEVVEDLARRCAERIDDASV